MKREAEDFRGIRMGPYVLKIILIVCLLVMSLPPVAQAQEPTWPPPGCWVEGDQFDPDAEKVLICIPTENWNGALVVYAHGYVAPQMPLTLPVEELKTFPELLATLLMDGFAFTTTS